MIEFKPDAHDTGACAVSSCFSDSIPMIKSTVECEGSRGLQG